MAPKLIDLDEMYIQSSGKGVESVEVVYQSNLQLKQSCGGEREASRSSQNNSSSNSNSQEMCIQTARTIMPSSPHQKKPLHKVLIGGPNSSFVPIVRVPSNEVVGDIHNHSQSFHDRSGSSAIHNNDDVNQRLQQLQQKTQPYNNSQSNLSRNILGWQSLDGKNLVQSSSNAAGTPLSEKIDFRFRPIISEDEKVQDTTATIPQMVKPKQLKKKKIHKIPVVEIYFHNDDNSYGSLSSMGYDGSEHDIEAIFKDAYMYPAYYDTREPISHVNENEGKLDKV